MFAKGQRVKIKADAQERYVGRGLKNYRLYIAGRDKFAWVVNVGTKEFSFSNSRPGAIYVRFGDLEKA